MRLFLFFLFGSLFNFNVFAQNDPYFYLQPPLKRIGTSLVCPNGFWKPPNEITELSKAFTWYSRLDTFNKLYPEKYVTSSEDKKGIIENFYKPKFSITFIYKSNELLIPQQINSLTKGLWSTPVEKIIGNSQGYKLQPLSLPEGRGGPMVWTQEPVKYEFIDSKTSDNVEIKIHHVGDYWGHAFRCIPNAIQSTFVTQSDFFSENKYGERINNRQIFVTIYNFPLEPN
jgi:hypothetical protein